jgi:hypothetical protein
MMMITLSVDTGFIIVWYDPATLLDPKYSLVRRLQTVMLYLFENYDRSDRFW